MSNGADIVPPQPPPPFPPPSKFAPERRARLLTAPHGGAVSLGLGPARCARPQTLEETQVLPWMNERKGDHTAEQQSVTQRVIQGLEARRQAGRLLHRASREACCMIRRRSLVFCTGMSEFVCPGYLFKILQVAHFV